MLTQVLLASPAAHSMISYTYGPLPNFHKIFLPTNRFGVYTSRNLPYGC